MIRTSSDSTPSAPQPEVSAGTPLEARVPPRAGRARHAVRRVRSLIHRTSASLPDGTMRVGLGLVISGGAVYGFLGITARVLGPESYAPLSVLWSLVFLVGPGVFLPLEQEVGRTLAGRGAGNPLSESILRRGTVLGGLLSLVLLIVVVAASPFLLAHLFAGNSLLLAGLALAVPSFAAMHLMRGWLAGIGRFGAYSLLIGSEGGLRLAAAAVMAAAGVRSSGLYGLVIGAATVAAVVLVLLVARPRIPPRGEPVSWAQLTESLGYLMLGSLVSQTLINAGPLAVQLLADESQVSAAGRLLAGIVLTRIPLYLFQAVQASLLPKLASLGAAGDLAAFGRGMTQLLGIIAAVTVVGVTAAFLVGPAILVLLFGPDFVLGRLDLALLALSSCLMMAAQAFGQALVALRRHARAAQGWMTGAACFVGVTLVGKGLFARVELGLIAGAAASTIMLGATLWSSVDRNRRTRSAERI